MREGAAIITRASLSVWIRTAKKILSSHIGTSMLLGGGGGAGAHAHTHAHTHTCEQTQHRDPNRKILQILICSFSKHEAVFFIFFLLYFRCTAAPKKKTPKNGPSDWKKKGCGVNVFALRDDPSVFGSWARLDHMI